MRFKCSNLQPVFTIASYVLLVLILVIIWVAPISHYYVPNVSIPDKIIEAARRQPDNAVFDEISRFFQSSINKDKQLVTKAEQILQGKLDIPAAPSSGFAFPFDADDLDKEGSDWQLFFARLSIPYLLLNAYEETGRDDFLIAAKDVILGFASYERNAWLPKGFLWNDHAIAGRISVMAKFWKLYRNHPDYQSEVARDLFQMVARSAQLLAKPELFTFATNHGIMQNLALWQICLAFPTLPKIAFYKQLAFERMKDQMRFYVNDEGVVLEHSAGYQRHGIRFMDLALSYLTLLEIPIPEDWKVKYQKAEAFYAQLLRPDGSLPMFGDTGAGRKNDHTLSITFDTNGKIERVVGKEKWILKKAHRLYSVAGYSIWWDGLDEWSKQDKLSQTVVAWSYFPGHAHKHADEMSVLLWAGGHNWWTNIGCWPYGMKGRSHAVSWAGSNAPHMVNEATKSNRQTRLISYGGSDSLAVLDLERKGPQEYVARRQVVHLKPNLWIVLDHTFGNEDQRTTTTWTTAHDVILSEGELPGSYLLQTEGKNIRLTKYIFTSENVKLSQFKGSLSPFAGWETHRPAPSIVIEQPANDSWAAAIWSLQESGEEDLKINDIPFMKDWKNPEDWQIGLPLASGLMNIWRENDHVFVQEDPIGTGIQKELKLSAASKIQDELDEIHTAYDNSANKYLQKKGYSMHRHLKATYFLIVLLLVQEFCFLIYRRISAKHYAVLRGMSAVGWIAVGTLLFGVYL